MKDGKIQHQGTVEEIQEKDPELYNTWQDAIQHASEEEEAATSSGEETDVQEEREKLKRQISRQITFDENKDKSGKLFVFLLYDYMGIWVDRSKQDKLLCQSVRRA